MVVSGFNIYMILQIVRFFADTLSKINKSYFLIKCSKANDFTPSEIQALHFAYIVYPARGSVVRTFALQSVDQSDRPSQTKTL